MRREARLNLWVVVGVVILMIPGGIMLVRKKGQPGERAIGSPDPVRKTTAWMDPYPGASVARLAPLRALQWVGLLAMDDVAAGARRVSRPTTVPVVVEGPRTRTPGNVGEAIFYGEQPGGSAAAQVMSEGCWFQVVSRGEGWLRLVVWDEAVGQPVAEVNGAAASILRARVVELPLEVRHDLQEAGYVMPPKRVAVVDVACAQAPKRVTLAATRRRETATLP